jgi:hypothetical protein
MFFRLACVLALALPAHAGWWEPSPDGRELDYIVQDNLTAGKPTHLCGLIVFAQNDSGLMLRGHLEAYGLGSGGAKTTGLLETETGPRRLEDDTHLKRVVEAACR